MTEGDKLVIVCGAAKRRPAYRDAYLAEFTARPFAELTALWIEALLRQLAEEWRKRGRCGW